MEVKKDVAWWKMFMAEFTGVAAIPKETWHKPDSIFITDSCLTECGGHTEKEFFHGWFPEKILQMCSGINNL